MEELGCTRKFEDSSIYEEFLTKKGKLKAERSDVYKKLIANFVFSVLLFLFSTVLFSEMNDKPEFQAQGIVSDLFLNKQALVCVVDGKSYELGSPTVVGLEIPTSLRQGDEVAIYKLYRNYFSAAPSVSYEVVCEEKVDKLMPVGGAIFCSFAFMFAFCVVLNCITLKTLNRKLEELALKTEEKRNIFNR